MSCYHSLELQTGDFVVWLAISLAAPLLTHINEIQAPCQVEHL